jgi:hypothetical protein
MTTSDRQLASPEAALVAGLIAERFDSIAATDNPSLTQALRDVLSPSTLWERVGVTSVANAPLADSRGLARWSAPQPLEPSEDERLLGVWHDVVPSLEDETGYLRLAVRSIGDARQLPAPSPTLLVAVAATRWRSRRARRRRVVGNRSG